MLVDRKGALDKVKRAIDFVQDNEFFNDIATDALGLVPFAGSVLVKYWDKYKDSKETDPRETILETLETMKMMNESKLESFCMMIEKNTEKVLDSRIYLQKIVSQQKEILNEIRATKSEIKKEVQKVGTNVNQIGKEIEYVKKHAKNTNTKIDVTTKLTLENQEILKEVRNEISQLQRTKSKYGISSQVYAMDEEGTKTSIREEIGEHYSKITALIKNKDIQSVKESLPMDADYALEEANAFFITGNYDVALELYKKIYEQNPKNRTVLLNLGYAYWKIGNIEQALPYLNKINEIEPSDYSGQALRTRIFFEDGKIELAEKICDDLIYEYDDEKTIDKSSMISLMLTKIKILIENEEYFEVFEWLKKIDEILDNIKNKNEQRRLLRIIENQSFVKAFELIDEDKKYDAYLIIKHLDYLYNIIFKQVKEIPKVKHDSTIKHFICEGLLRNGLVKEFNEYREVRMKKHDHYIAEDYNTLIHLFGIIVKNVNLDKINLSDVSLSHATFENVSLKEADLSFSYLGHGEFIGCNFEGSDLTYSRFEDSDLKNSNLSLCKATNVKFWRTKLDNVRFMGAELKDAGFFGSTYQQSLMNDDQKNKARWKHGYNSGW